MFNLFEFRHSSPSRTRHSHGNLTSTLNKSCDSTRAFETRLHPRPLRTRRHFSIEQQGSLRQQTSPSSSGMLLSASPRRGAGVGVSLNQSLSLGHSFSPQHQPSQRSRDSLEDLGTGKPSQGVGFLDNLEFLQETMNEDLADAENGHFCEWRVDMTNDSSSSQIGSGSVLRQRPGFGTFVTPPRLPQTNPLHTPQKINFFDSLNIWDGGDGLETSPRQLAPMVVTNQIENKAEMSNQNLIIGRVTCQGLKFWEGHYLLDQTEQLLGMLLRCCCSQSSRYYRLVRTWQAAWKWWILECCHWEGQSHW